MISPEEARPEKESLSTDHPDRDSKNIAQFTAARGTS